MGKKKGRSRKSSAARRQKAARAAALSATGTRKASRRSASKKVDFATEYHYVLGDLKRFAILAVAMFATLMVLALVVR